MYVNYYANEVNDEGDDKPIGIILCADTSEVVAEYALGGLENQIFASKYVYPKFHVVFQSASKFAIPYVLRGIQVVTYAF